MRVLSVLSTGLVNDGAASLNLMMNVVAAAVDFYAKTPTMVNATGRRRG
jgi:hypothetical protein